MGGMDIARLNRSHGTIEGCREKINSIRNICKSNNKCVALMIDTKGAEIRTGVIAHPVNVKEGEEIIFSSFEMHDDKRSVIEVNYDRFYADVPETDRIIIDNGELILDIVKINKDGSVIARAQSNGSIGSRRHITLPGADIDLPSVTDQDWEDIAFAVEEEVDFLALSFVRTADDVNKVRGFIKEKGGSIQIIPKIETRQAVENISEIIEVSDGIMIARGDLGTDLPFEELPPLQDEIVIQCRDRGVPVIVATHMLESMIEHPMPTRAEVTDVAHAVMTGADATMLSGETAAGNFPLKAIEAMSRIQNYTENHLSRFPRNYEMPVHNEREARAEAAVTLSESAEASLIFVFTRTGKTAKEVSKFHPKKPIIAFTDSSSIQRTLKLCYGIHPYVIPFTDPESTVTEAFKTAIKYELVKEGDDVVLLSDIEAKDATVSSVQVRRFG